MLCDINYNSMFLTSVNSLMSSKIQKVDIGHVIVFAFVKFLSGMNFLICCESEHLVKVLSHLLQLWSFSSANYLVCSRM